MRQKVQRRMNHQTYSSEDVKSIGRVQRMEVLEALTMIDDDLV
jgi:hypothetical protein